MIVYFRAFFTVFIDLWPKFLTISPHPPWIYVTKDALNHFLVNSSAKNSLRRTENVVFSLFCILVDRPMGWLSNTIGKFFSRGVLEELCRNVLTVHGRRTKPDIKDIFFRLSEQKSFFSSSCIIIANIKCTFWQESILENRFRGNVYSDKCTFWQVFILENRFSGKCPFGEMYILASVRSGKCTFGTMSIWPSVFRENVLSGRYFSGRCTGSLQVR